MKMMFTNHNYTKQKEMSSLWLLEPYEKSTFATTLGRY